jgi:hypothetical protein
MNEWSKFVTKFYKDKKRTNKTYKFKDAMKDAKGPYNAAKGAKGGKTRKSRK